MYRAAPLLLILVSDIGLDASVVVAHWQTDELDLAPRIFTAPSKGREIAKLKKGDSTGNADINSAKAIQSDIAEEFAGYGVK